MQRQQPRHRVRRTSPEPAFGRHPELLHEGTRRADPAVRTVDAVSGMNEAEVEVGLWR